MSETKIKMASALVSLVAIIVIGTIGLSYLEGWSLFNALWVTIISLTTTGYGDIVPHSSHGRIFLLLILVIGVGTVAYSMGVIISVFVETQISIVLGRSKMKEAIAGLNNHIIVCGAGRVGQSVAHILKVENAPYVLIDNNEELIEGLQQRGELAMVGDATVDEILMEAGLQRAQGIVSALSNDAYNVYVVLSARNINPSLKIVARAERPETVDKLQRAGADKVVAPTEISGHHMAMAILKPVSVDLVDTLITANNVEFQLEEVLITDHSNLAHKQIKEVFKRDLANVIIVAIIRDGQIIMSPRGAETILPCDTLIMLGSRRDLEITEKSAFETSLTIKPGYQENISG